jgi:hypothetical protein
MNHSYNSQDPEYLAFIKIKLTEKITDDEIFKTLKCEPGDELWKYNTIECLCGSMGVAVVRNNKVVKQYPMGLG